MHHWRRGNDNVSEQSSMKFVQENGHSFVNESMTLKFVRSNATLTLVHENATHKFVKDNATLTLVHEKATHKIRQKTKRLWMVVTHLIQFQGWDTSVAKPRVQNSWSEAGCRLQTGSSCRWWEGLNIDF